MTKSECHLDFSSPPPSKKKLLAPLAQQLLSPTTHKTTPVIGREEGDAHEPSNCSTAKVFRFRLVGQGQHR